MNGGGSTTKACVATDNFDRLAFMTDVLPILLGQKDLNHPTAPGTGTGCAGAMCHGANRTGGALVIQASASVDQNLANVSCFVNLSNPVRSALLLCPTADPACPHAPHPGQMVFAGTNDANYQRVLAFLYGAKSASSPLDFAFFARVINPILDENVAGRRSGITRACTDQVSCHGVAAVGQTPPNGSSLGLLSGATDKARLAANFATTSNFVDFLKPESSLLYLNATDEIADTANPAATGMHHAGGQLFGPDSQEAQTILAWAGGLRPDTDGALRAWLVAGDYPATAIDDPTAIDEVNVTPGLFDEAGSSRLLGGEWDATFSRNERVDLENVFPEFVRTTGRAVYAVAYLVNTGPTDLMGMLTVTSPNSVRVLAGTTEVVKTDDARAGTTGMVMLPSGAHAATRLLVKLVEQRNDRQLNFSVQLTTGGNAVVIKLGPDGGI
jgi:hypothetical protein